MLKVTKPLHSIHFLVGGQNTTPCVYVGRARLDNIMLDFASNPPPHTMNVYASISQLLSCPTTLYAQSGLLY